MDMDSEFSRLKFILIADIVFLVSLFASYSELKYLAYGKEADARLISVKEF